MKTGRYMLTTFHAPAERDEIAEIMKMYRSIRSVAIIHELMSKMEQDIFILNKHRQTVYVNKAAMDRYGIESPENVLGLRPGEIFKCQFSFTDGGCGTSKFCRDCGAVNSILKTQLENIETVDECVICSKDGTTYELAVTSKPFELSRNTYTVFSISDVGVQKRMQVLEKIFFHDIINIAGGIHSMLQLMQDDRFDDKERIHELLVASSAQLLNELNAHKLLKAAEINDLLVQKAHGNSLKILGNSVSIAENLKCAYGKVIYLDSSSHDFELLSDETLLNRVLLNMLTNALEASSVGERVTAGVNIKDGKAVFWVHNNQVIEDEHKHKIFQRSFTTKKRGSGLGTHSIKTLTERYLNGEVTFESVEGKGTIFTVKLPLD